MEESLEIKNLLKTPFDDMQIFVSPKQVNKNPFIQIQKFITPNIHSHSRICTKKFYGHCNAHNITSRSLASF